MNRQHFDTLLGDFEKREQSLLGYKRSEYASEDGDVLVNFKENGEFLGMPPEEVCLTYLMKHIQAIRKGVCDPDTRLGWMNGDREGFSQRISDARNYLILLAACIDERTSEDQE